MTPEEIDRHFEFIIKQQAQFAADVQEINATLKVQSDLLVKQNGAIVFIVDSLGKLAEAQRQSEERWEKRWEDLGQAQKETEERLNAFITFVEKYISAHGNGHKTE
ncbi:MAG: hypothetical protein ACRD2B_11610 [Terriglobia bacterium]